MSMPTMVLGEKQSALPRSQPGALRGSALSSALMQYFTMFNGIRRSLNVVSSVRWTDLSKVITSEAEQSRSRSGRDARPEEGKMLARASAALSLSCGPMRWHRRKSAALARGVSAPQARCARAQHKHAGRPSRPPPDW